MAYFLTCRYLFTVLDKIESSVAHATTSHRAMAMATSVARECRAKFNAHPFHDSFLLSPMCSTVCEFTRTLVEFVDGISKTSAASLKSFSTMKDIYGDRELGLLYEEHRKNSLVLSETVFYSKFDASCRSLQARYLLKESGVNRPMMSNIEVQVINALVSSHLRLRKDLSALDDAIAELIDIQIIVLRGPFGQDNPNCEKKATIV